MKTSKFIEVLQDLQEKHGDADIAIFMPVGFTPPECIRDIGSIDRVPPENVEKTELAKRFPDSDGLFVLRGIW